jgi:apolipoprotein D and lipocalin family protein
MIKDLQPLTSWMDGKRAGMLVGALFAVGLTAHALPARASVTLAPVSMQNYDGRWHEIARTPNRLQQECRTASVVYAYDAKSVSAVHRCERADRTDKITRLEGRILDPGVNAKLRLTYAGILSKEYWILAVADDWAIVGEPNGKYIWLMSRTAKMAPAKREAALARISDLGYDVSKLEFLG